MPHSPTRAVAVLASSAALSAGLVACSSSTSHSPSAPSASTAGASHTAKVTISAARGCTSEPASLTAGGITFMITNKDATAVSEVELLDGERIIGEKENLPPGLNGRFAVKVPAGEYTLYCPGASTEKRAITVTGTAAAVDDSTAALLKTATSQYKRYVDAQVGYMLASALKLATALHGKSLVAARIAYKQARPYYEKIEPVAESFVNGTQNLDAGIDARANDVPASQWSGYHRIEKGLFQTKSLAGLGRWGDKLVADVRTLKSKTGELTYQAPDLANGASGLLDEVAKTKISGEEERYSHIDIQDMANNVEGSEQAFADLQPIVAKIDATLASTISSRFAALQQLVDSYRSSADPSGYVLYGALDNSDRRALAAAVKAVQEPLARVGSKVANA